MGVIQVESGFDPDAVSDKNARGLMQIHWTIWKHYFSSPEEAHDIIGAKDDRYADKVISSAAAFKKRVLYNPNIYSTANRANDR